MLKGLNPTFNQPVVTDQNYDPTNYFALLSPAGGYVMSNNAVKDFYYASYFVKRFKFDDVYLGLISKKIEIEPFHSDEFHFYHKPYTIKGYQYVVGSHGFSDPKVLEKVWNKQKEAGNA